MVKRCSICGKSAIFGTMFNCNSCKKYICHRHEKEQFIRYFIPGIEGGNSSVSHNYPDGRAVNYETFRCYECRTGKTPKDMGNLKMLVEDYLVIFSLASIIIFAIMAILSIFGNHFGLSPETCKNLETTCIYYVVTVIVISLIVAIIIGISFRLKRKKSL